jgi:HEAT repeat protein
MQPAQHEQGGFVESSNPIGRLPDPDIKLITGFIHEMNIARRVVASYPEDHPLIGRSVDKVLKILSRLLSERKELTLGVAKNALMLKDSFLDRNNPINRDVARLLFSQGIAAVSFFQQLTEREMVAFFGLSSLKREEIEAEGGIAHALAARNINGIQVRPIDYSAFQSSDEESVDGEDSLEREDESHFLWECFVQSLLEETLDQQGQLINLDPEVLAELLNRRKHGEGGLDEVKSYAYSLASFIRQLVKVGQGAMRERLICRLATFITRLTPEMRSQFLSSVFSALSDRPELAEALLSQIPEEAIIAALEEMNACQESLPQMMLGIIGRLSDNLAKRVAQFAASNKFGGRDPVEERIRTIFQEERLDKHLPEAYQRQLQTILAEGLQTSLEDLSEIEELKVTLAQQIVEENISFIILEILNTPWVECDPQVMEKNLVDLCNYFLGLGDYSSLIGVYEKILSRADAGGERRLHEVLGVFSKGEFVREVLNGLRLWGKNKYQDIAILIDRIGWPFVEPLLERLAEEESMSLRRYYMDRLLAMGGVIMIPVAERLRDDRWYFVRNMILLLRNLGDDEAVPQIRRMTGHPHPRVRQEAIQALLHFGDGEANRLLMRDLRSPDIETVIGAVRLAEGSDHPEVFRRLVELLNRRGLAPIDCEIKSAVLHSLGKMGNPLAVTELQRLLSSRSLLRSSQLNRLKEDAVRSLKFYPKDAVYPILADLAKSGPEGVKQRAQEILRQIQRGEDVS